MTKKDFIQALDGLDDGAQIIFDIRNEGLQYFVENIQFLDKVIGTEFQNEITIFLGVS